MTDPAKPVAVPLAPGVRVEVTWKGGAAQHIALAPEEIEAGDMLMLTGPFTGRCIQLTGTNASGVKSYVEVDAPKKDEKTGELVGVKVTDVTRGDGAPAASAIEKLMAGTTFPAPGPSKPLIGDDGEPLPAPKVKDAAPAVPATITPPAPTPA